MSTPLRVLLVEDSENDAILIIRELRHSGYVPTFERVDTPETFIAALARQTWDAVIADYSMPSFSGLAALMLLKESGLDLPFIVVSGAIGEDVAVSAMKAGAHDYVMKDNLARLGPAVQRELHEAKVRLARRRAEEEIRRRAAHQEALNTIIAAAAATADLPGLLETALDHTLGALGLEMGSVWVPPHAAVRGLPPEIQRVLNQAASAAGLDIPSSYSVEDWHREAANSPLSAIHPIMVRFGVRASLTVPLLVEKRRIGGVSVATPEPRSWSSEEIALVEAVGQQLGGAAERLHLLDKTRKQAQQIQQIMDTVPEGVLLLDAAGRVVLANPVAEEDLLVLAGVGVGGTLTHLGERPLAELLIPPPKGLRHETTTDGRSFQVIAQPVEAGPTPGGWVLVTRDVTQQRVVEQRIQQQERLAAVGQMAAGIAHDFNNIMATIVLYAHMVARVEGLSTRDRGRMETINQQAKHATQLIQQILDFSRRAVLERRPLDLAPFLKEQVKLLERTLPESIEVKLDCGPDEYIVNADPTRMQQIVANLALNARDAMPEGGELCIGLEHIRVKPGESPLLPEMGAGEWVQVTVSDTGTGIPPDVLPHVFDPFFTTKEPGEGTGLGLAQVHGIVGSHDGHIDLKSQIGQKTTFTIYLPALSTRPVETPTLEMSTLAKGQGETILVVEDSASTRKALVESLEELNYRVLEAANGQEALTMLEQRSAEIALVLSDVVMPRMGGIALLHALRERGLPARMVMVTGHLLQKELEDLRAQGIIDWLPKPPELEQLAEVVARALNRESD